MQTLSFKEYREMKRLLGRAVDPSPAAELDRCILEGGFPRALGYPRVADKHAYVGSFIKEVFERGARGCVKAKGVSAFNRARDCAVNNFGASTSLTNILSDPERRGARNELGTPSRCLQMLEDAKVISRCARFDMKSRESLQGGRGTASPTRASTSRSTRTAASAAGRCSRASSAATRRA